MAASLTTYQVSFQEATGDGNLIAQVTASIFKQAANVYGEASSAQHAARATLANRLSTGQQPMQPLIMSAVCFAGLNASTPDATVDNSVSSLWNLWAGA